jgi:hypothetical protein
MATLCYDQQSVVAKRMRVCWARAAVVLQAPPAVQQSVEEGVNVTGDFCSLDASGKRLKDRTMGEMEQVGSCVLGAVPGVVGSRLCWEFLC